MKAKAIPNEDFDCNPKGECWCKEEEVFKGLPESDICYSPDEIQEIRDTLSQNEVKRFQRQSRYKIVRELVSWPIRYKVFRLKTMYGSRWFFYIAKHPIRVIKQLFHFTDWCIMMDKHRILKDKYTRQV